MVRIVFAEKIGVHEALADAADQFAFQGGVGGPKLGVGDSVGAGEKFWAVGGFRPVGFEIFVINGVHFGSEPGLNVDAVGDVLDGDSGGVGGVVNLFPHFA